MKILCINITILFLCTLFACQKETSDVPSLEFIGLSSLALDQNQADSLFLTFKFKDGDGDLVGDQTAIFVSDSRNDALLATFKIPNPGLFNPGQAQEGEMTIQLYSPCCIYADTIDCIPNTLIPEDEFNFKLKAIDLAGHQSNIIESDRITLNCI